MAIYKPAAGTRIIDAITGAVIEIAPGNRYYESGGYTNDGRGGFTTKPGSVGFEGGDPGTPVQTQGKSVEQLNVESGAGSQNTRDVFGNTIGDQAGTIYKNQAEAQRQGAVQYATNGQFTDGLGQQLNGVIQNMASQGMVINPNKKLTPLDVSEFMAKASAEIDPYYAEQLRVGRENYLRSQGFDTETILKNEKELERKYGKSVKATGENFAEQGFAQSGLRQEAERDLATDTQSQIDEARRTLNFNAGSRALDFAGKYGSQNLPGSSITTAPQVSAGQSTFNRGAGTQNLYNVSESVLNDIVGSQEKERVSSARDLAQFYETQARKAQTIPTDTYNNPIQQATRSLTPSSQTIATSYQSPTGTRTLNETSAQKGLSTTDPKYYNFLPGETVEQYKKRFTYS